MTDKNLTLIGRVRGHGDGWWWDWDVDGVDARDWRADEIEEIESMLWEFYVERIRDLDWRPPAKPRVRVTFTREGMVCNMDRRHEAYLGAGVNRHAPRASERT